MRAPEFWSRDSLAARLLSPLSLAWVLGGRLRAAWATPWRAAAPVICVGNATLGGAGKTPVAITLAGMLRDLGRKPALISRGYGARARGPRRVDPAKDSAGDVGDEPLLLARAAPTWIGRDRSAAMQAALDAGADCLLLDDGLQNPTFHKDLSLLVLDGPAGFGNGRVFPAGPLREPIAAVRARVQAIVLVGPDATGATVPLRATLPVLPARLVPAADAERFAGRKLLAFAGIGRPEKFFQTLRALGATLVACEGFADHHRYSPDEIMLLAERAAAAQARLVTTSKDAVRLPAEAKAMVEVLEISLLFETPEVVRALLGEALAVPVARPRT
jgi:tetraacyldisaccharide 4'-kinase